MRGNPIRQFLLMEHADRLDLPKGHLDKGESELQCALRELEEETSISASEIELDPKFRFVQRYSVWPKKFNGEECEKTLVVFLGQLHRDTVIRLTEHQGFRWVNWNPPHQIQAQTIDPLLAELDRFLNTT